MNGMDGGDVKLTRSLRFPCDVLAQRMRLPAGGMALFGGLKLHHRAVVDSDGGFMLANPQFNPE